MCYVHVDCPLQYFPNHYQLTAVQPLPSYANKADGCEKQAEKEVAATRWQKSASERETSWWKKKNCERVCLYGLLTLHWLPCYSVLLPWSQPFMPILLPSGHTLHFMPFTPVLQEHKPDICSQSSRTEPVASQLHAAVERERKKEDWLEKKEQLGTMRGKGSSFMLCTECLKQP